MRSTRVALYSGLPLPQLPRFLRVPQPDDTHLRLCPERSRKLLPWNITIPQVVAVRSVRVLLLLIILPLLPPARMHRLVLCNVGKPLWPLMGSLGLRPRRPYRRPLRASLRLNRMGRLRTPARLSCQRLGTIVTRTLTATLRTVVVSALLTARATATADLPLFKPTRSLISFVRTLLPWTLSTFRAMDAMS